MKVYIVKDEDIEHLLAVLDRDPKYGQQGGSSQVLSPVEEDAHERAHNFFNYQIRVWIDSIKK